MSQEVRDEVIPEGGDSIARDLAAAGLDPVVRDLAAAGFDLVWPFDAHAIGKQLGVPALLDPAWPSGLLVGNTRALWPVFTAARQSDPALAACPDPLDLYTEQTIDRIAAGARVLYAHRRDGGAYLPFQRIAVAVGAGTSSPSQLVIHPVYGPWFGLRAIVGVEHRFTTCNSVARSEVGAPDPALVRAMSATGPDAWREWLALRDACPVGREHRYSDEQIAYHYSFLAKMLQ